jgi:N-acyl-D-amino-acid deacylase
MPLIEDGACRAPLRQGVTPRGVRRELDGAAHRSDGERSLGCQGTSFNISWRTLGGYLDHLVARGISTNVASFVSAATVRANEIGLADRAPTAAELERMRVHVRTAMDEGAMGLTTALIYVPGVFAKTGELVELAKVASASGGMYISHMRSEGNRLLEAIDETLTIAREAKIRAEIYHLKESGQTNWSKLDSVITKIEGARKEGLNTAERIPPPPDDRSRRNDAGWERSRHKVSEALGRIRDPGSRPQGNDDASDA